MHTPRLTARYGSSHAAEPITVSEILEEYVLQPSTRDPFTDVLHALHAEFLDGGPGVRVAAKVFTGILSLSVWA